MNIFTKKVESIKYKERGSYLSFPPPIVVEGRLQRESCLTSKYKTPASAGVTDSLSTPSISAGFTLVETLVAIAILMIAVAGPLTVAEKGLSASIYARDQLMASYLAQDAMESIKNIVDTNEINIGNGTYEDDGDQWISDENGSRDLSSLCTSPSNSCYIDTTYNPPAISRCTAQPNGSPCQSLYLSSSGYIMTGGSPNAPTPFTRYFYIQGFNLDGIPDSPYTAANVIVNVIWPGDVIGGGGVDLEDTMFDTQLQ